MYTDLFGKVKMEGPVQRRSHQAVITYRMKGRTLRWTVTDARWKTSLSGEIGSVSEAGTTRGSEMPGRYWHATRSGRKGDAPRALVVHI